MKRWNRIVIAGCITALCASLGLAAMLRRNPEALQVSGTETVQGQEELNLYARSAVLMDADSGRILYGKNEEEPMAMASTTKIMTLIVALENQEADEIVTASSYAAAQPKVHLGMYAGEQFHLEDLYYSLMLESHNDTAVCIAEHLGTRFLGKEWSEVDKDTSKEAVRAFLDRMNEKAAELGLKNTCFLTPNGLDAEITQEDGTVRNHQTTASELAAILKYCIEDSPMKEKFLEITRTASYSFSDIEGKSTFSCTNHNAFLQMMEGALTGKTGFTAKAGYCYVGALERDGRTFIVTLLACGWPNNKSYKWVDTKTLMNYGLENYSYQDVYRKDLNFEPVSVINGVAENGNWMKKAYASVGLSVRKEEQTLSVLLNEVEQVKVVYEGKESVAAPVTEGLVVGHVRYSLNGELLAEYPVTVRENVDRLDYSWCLKELMKRYVPIW